VRLLQGAAFDEVFRTFERAAFHLEVEDSYHTPDESEPFQRFLRGEPDDFAWHRPWLDLVRGTTATGRRVERVRIVSVPHVDYTRWGLTVAPLNIAAGEDIRWLPRHLAAGMNLTSDDFWLIDDNRVVFTVFTRVPSPVVRKPLIPWSSNGAARYGTGSGQPRSLKPTTWTAERSTWRAPFTRHAKLSDTGSATPARTRGDRSAVGHTRRLAELQGFQD
jgi:hypothetical protein